MHTFSIYMRMWYMYIYVLLLMIPIVYMITLHLWDTGSVGIPINNQITYMAEFWDYDTEYTLLLMITNVYYQKDVLRFFGNRCWH